MTCNARFWSAGSKIAICVRHITHDGEHTDCADLAELLDPASHARFEALVGARRSIFNVVDANADHVREALR